ncbi:MAG: hypothetical protein WAN65_20920 [Candidatus Sulfotelmatobacter sp.]
MALAFVCPAILAAQTSSPVTAPPAQAHLTAEQDHQRMMDLLHITSLRRGPDGDPKSANAANFDESKVRSYSLPDPLVLKNGKKVKTAKMWWKQRRHEIAKDFDREVYGRAPRNTPKVNWEVTESIKENIGDVPAITKKLVGHVDNSSYPLIQVDIQLTLTTPASAAGPVPVIMEFGLSPEVLAALRKRFTEAQWAAFAGNGPPWQQQVLAKGWGYAILIPASVQADHGEGLTQGIIGLMNKGQPRKLDDWGALRAWAWGASRALDYFETDKSVDAKQVGHRRPIALRKSGTGGDGLRTTAGDCVCGIVGSRWREDSAPQLWRAGGKHRIHRRISLDGRQLSEVRRTTLCDRPSG